MNEVDPTEELLLTMEDAALAAFHSPQTTVLEAVQWQVRRGEFWVVAGHHGSGKSDLLLSAAGLMGPVRGRCTLFGQVMPGFARAGLAARLKTGLVFEDARLLNHLTLGGNVRLPLCYHRALNEAEAAQQIQPLLEVTGLAPMADSAPGMVGPPWQLRTALARALVLAPELLLLDEPLAGLDTRHAAWWVEFLRKLHRGGVGWPPGSREPESAPSVARPGESRHRSAATDSLVAAGDSALRTPHSALAGGVTVVVASGTLDPWCEVATHCAVVEAGRFSVRGPLRQAMQAGDEKLREFAGFTRAAFDRPPTI